MIFSALQTLNEEAHEDVIEEQVKKYIENNALDQDSNTESSRICTNTDAASEIDAVYIRTSPLFSEITASCSPESESATPSIVSNLSISPNKACLSRSSSVKTMSVPASPRKKHQSYSNSESKNCVNSNPQESSQSSHLQDIRNLHKENSITLNTMLDGVKGLNTKFHVKPDAKVSEDLIVTHNVNLSRAGLETFQETSKTNEKLDYEVRNSYDDLNSDLEIFDTDEMLSFTSLPGSSSGLTNGTIIKSLSGQIPSTSSPSLNRIRKLSKKLQKVFSSSEISDFEISQREQNELVPLMAENNNENVLQQFIKEFKNEISPCSQAFQTEKNNVNYSDRFRSSIKTKKEAISSSHLTRDGSRTRKTVVFDTPGTDFNSSNIREPRIKAATFYISGDSPV